MSTFTERPTGTLSRFKSQKVEVSRSYGLAATHKAVVGNRTLFPTTVKAPMDSKRLLVSGENNAKLGEHVTKGPRAGWKIFQLTLEERATCPASCAQWRNCYGNAMHMARRHAVDENLLPLLRAELTLLSRKYPAGFLVRLHTLGDFFSPAYVKFWGEMLEELPALHVFGFTARREDADDANSRKTAEMIRWLTERAWDAFSIRFSRPDAVPQGSIVVDEPSKDPNVIMCPAQTEATTACASCGLCWAPAAQHKTIGFLRHGMKRAGGPRGPQAARSQSRDVGRRMLLAALNRAADSDGLVTMSIIDLAAEARSHTYAVNANLAALIERGVVEIADRGRPGHAATYRVIGTLDDPSPPAVAVAHPQPQPPARKGPVTAQHLANFRLRQASSSTSKQ